MDNRSRQRQKVLSHQNHDILDQYTLIKKWKKSLLTANPFFRDISEEALMVLLYHLTLAAGANPEKEQVIFATQGNILAFNDHPYGIAVPNWIDPDFVEDMLEQILEKCTVNP